MLSISPQTRILLAVEPVDFRRGIDGLCWICRSVLDKEPFSGTVFVFVNRRRNALKLLLYDGQGFWLCHKRLSVGRFRFWPKMGTSKVRRLFSHELGVILFGGDPDSTRVAPLFRPVALVG